MILLKYHPRETQKYAFDSGNIYEIESIIPAEKLLADLSDKHVTVIGNATTSILVSNKLGFRTYSIAKACGLNNQQMFRQMNNMGIHIPVDLQELISEL